MRVKPFLCIQFSTVFQSWSMILAICLTEMSPHISLAALLTFSYSGLVFPFFQSSMNCRSCTHPFSKLYSLGKRLDLRSLWFWFAGIL